MDDNTMDRRVRRTKKQLRTALTELMLTKEVGDITVREIAEAADVNRGTFYAHYKDVNDLLSQLEDGVMDRLAELSAVECVEADEATLLGYLTNILVLCKNNADLFLALVCRNGDLDFREKLVNTLRGRRMRSFFRKYAGGDEHAADMFCDFAVAGMLSVTETWMQSGMKETPEELAEKGTAFIMRGINALK